MATRFSATEARLKAESAQKSLKDQRKQNEEIRKGQVKERAFIKAGWGSQRIKIISAAIDGESEIKVNPPIYLYKDLLSSGIQVIEEGLVKHQPHRRDEEADNDAFRRIKSEILQRFDEFIDASKHDLKGYYGGVTRFHNSHYEALHEAMDSDRDYMFYGDEIWLEDVPVDVSAKYFDYIDNIDKKIREYRDLRRDVELKVEDDFYGDKLINGEYIFTEDDIDEDLLKPSVEGNKPLTVK